MKTAGRGIKPIFRLFFVIAAAECISSLWLLLKFYWHIEPLQGILKAAIAATQIAVAYDRQIKRGKT